jgi:hypothetical protein
MTWVFSETREGLCYACSDCDYKLTVPRGNTPYENEQLQKEKMRLIRKHEKECPRTKH